MVVFLSMRSGKAAALDRMDGPVVNGFPRQPNGIVRDAPPPLSAALM